MSIDKIKSGPTVFFVLTCSVVYDNELANQEHFYDSVNEIKTMVECEFDDVLVHNDAVCDEQADGDMQCSTDVITMPSSHNMTTGTCLVISNNVENHKDRVSVNWI